MSKVSDTVVIENRHRSEIELPGVKEAKDRLLARGHVLVPGDNTVNKAYWDRVKSNPGVKIYLAAKLIVGKGLGEAIVFEKSLDELDQSQALELICKCDDTKTINKWSKGSESDAIKEACKGRIEELISSAGKDAE